MAGERGFGSATAHHRILFLTSSSSRYGSERALTELISELGRWGTQAAVVVPSDGPLVDVLREAGVPTSIQPLTVIGRGMAPRRILQLGRAVARPRPELVRFAGEFGPTVIYSNTSHVLEGPALARACSVPHLWHLREIERVPSFVRRVFALWLLATSKQVIAISHSVREAYFGERFRRPVVVHDGIDRAHYCSGAPYVAPETFDGDRPLRALCVARITRWKGQHVAVAAVAALAGRGRPVVLRVVGDAFTADDEVYLGELGESAAVAGVVSIEPGVADVRPLLQWCDVVVHSSTAPEPFGRSVVEAMAFPRTVVASALGGPIDVVTDDAGVLVPPGDTEALAAELDRLIGSPALLEGYAARGSIRSEAFSAGECARRVDQILSELSRDR